MGEDKSTFVLVMVPLNNNQVFCKIKRAPVGRDWGRPIMLRRLGGYLPTLQRWLHHATNRFRPLKAVFSKYRPLRDAVRETFFAGYE
jgi:hypothetical protein